MSSRIYTLRCWKLVIAISAYLVWTVSAMCQADERLWLDAKVNGKRAKLAFDSGTGPFVLLRQGAERLGVKIIEPPTNASVAYGEVLGGATELCTLWLEGEEGKVRFRVVDGPSGVDVEFDGVVGWSAYRHSIFQIDADAGKVRFLDRVSKKKISGWSSFGILTNAGDLELIGLGRTGTNASFRIDTGSDSGVDLEPSKWRLWKASHAHQPLTLDSFYSPAEGLVAREQGWASQISLGGLDLAGVPVMEATPTEVASAASGYEGTLGLTALKRLDVIIDGKSGVAYLHSRTGNPRLPLRHNRLGAVFLPRGSTDALVGQVADNSPAMAAGIRNGDMLLKVDNLDAQTEANAQTRFWSPAGTKVELLLKRGTNTFSTNIVLRDILPP